jgi:carboxyl-terminal processing protease
MKIKMNFKNTLLILAPLVFVAFGFFLKSQDDGEDILVKTVNVALQNYHYDPVNIDDSYSEKAYNYYLENIDPNKRLLLQSDVDAMDKYKYLLDDETIAGSDEFFNLSLDIINRQTSATKQYFTEILAKPFDFTVEEEVDFSDDIPYAKTPAELKERWRKYLKYNVLTRLYADQLTQEKSIENKDSGFIALSMDSLEAKARASVLKTHEDWYSRLERLDRQDRLNAYVNSLTVVYDPHTNYFPPADKDNFDIQMSGRLEGIGAQLQEKDGYIKITNIIPGGPSSLQGELKENDLILKVAQEGEEAVDIIDWRINDAVKIIRGKKGTKVTLTVRKPDGSIKNITITRDVVVLEETYAKSLVIKDKDKVKAGYVFLPSFYADFQNPRGRFSWKDVKAEIEKLKAENVKGIILDLRNNGGGSLDDVVKMAGLFIDQGPIVQVKEKGRPAQVLEDNFAGTDWDGALVIMVNEFSASASEIMAAAMQDYNRAIVIGSSSTHGKGTVQRFLPLNQTLRSKNAPDLGSIKLTIQKFYRINGDATQLKGVSSDIVLPDNYMYIKTGEKEEDFAMPWDQIPSSTYDKKSYSIPNKVIAKSQARVKASETFNLIEQNGRRWEAQREESKYSLNLNEYKLSEEKDKEEGKRFDVLNNISFEDFVIANTSADIATINADESRKKRNEDWIASVKKDPYIYEALQIIEDWN